MFHGYEVTFDPPVIPDTLKAKHLHRKGEKALEVMEENRVFGLRSKGKQEIPFMTRSVQCGGLQVARLAGCPSP